METIEEGPVTLAEKWEANRHIRNRIRSKGMLVVWPKPELVGKPTMASISLNIHALRILAEDWCPKQSGPKSPSVHAVRKEVAALRAIFQLPNDPAILHADAWGLKKLFSYGDAAVNPFYEVIYSFWSVRLKPEHAIEIFVVDSGDEESDFSAFMTVKSDPYGMASPGKNSKVKSQLKVEDASLNHDDSDCQLVMMECLLAKRAAAKAVGDTADTQPLDAVSFKALAESYQPPALPPVKRFEETDDHVLQRSLQTEFGRADAAGEAEPLQGGHMSVAGRIIAGQPPVECEQLDEKPSMDIAESLPAPGSDLEDPYDFFNKDSGHASSEDLESSASVQGNAEAEVLSMSAEPVIGNEVFDPLAHSQPGSTAIVDDEPLAPSAIAEGEERHSGAPLEAIAADSDDAMPCAEVPDPCEEQEEASVCAKQASSGHAGAPSAVTESEAPSSSKAEESGQFGAEDGEDLPEPEPVSRKSQFELKKEVKPKAKAKAKAKSKAKAQAKRACAKRRGRPGRGHACEKADAEMVNLCSDAEDLEIKAEETEEQEEQPKAPKPKRQAKRKAEALPAVAEEDMDDDKVVWGPVSTQGIEDFEKHWTAQDQNIKKQSTVDAEDRDKRGGIEEQCQQQEPTGADAAPRNALKSFARRPCPKTSPAKERWLAVRDVFESAIKPILEEVGFKTSPVEARF
ncbi:unnamed protein product [Durusdinium trenchii]|uniref:Uncharacterized protein n=1 Tax=Durusdinium trenchii TaxID=1381693 RepID=A0ABP0RAS6_9DINO